MADLECGQCGNPLERVGEECPKCGNREAVRADRKRVLEVDVAHGGETVERALARDSTPTYLVMTARTL